ncbi:dihydrofolate reductase [Stappia albiluteola]|uniref:dihydrofolate reductase n=1 Tax=Stappia albiluteola TaxID=2758565 RepID=UPI002E2CAFED|nr:dihydrofolate reductase [Stappia albiluteola]
MSAPRIVLVAAVAENGIIGSGNEMPWRLPTDLKHFKRLTIGRPVVMGRKTYESLGRPLPGRPNIVITRNPDFTAAGVSRVASLDEALALAAGLAEEISADSVIVMGGGEIYRQALSRADRLEITRVHAEPEGDTHFPEIDPSVWRETARVTPERGEKDSADMTFLTFERKSPA